MLDEALEIIAGLWRGEWFSYKGKHYQVDNVRFLPVPFQKPRIPIWVGGGYPNRGPPRRAARWDGSCMYKESKGTGWHDMMPGKYTRRSTQGTVKGIVTRNYQIAKAF